LTPREAHGPTSAANAAISHFSCWRRSPDERRQLATWPASDATKHAATSRKITVYAAFHHPAARRDGEYLADIPRTRAGGRYAVHPATCCLARPNSYSVCPSWAWLLHYPTMTVPFNL
jgi:hypothetical protein